MSGHSRIVGNVPCLDGQFSVLLSPLSWDMLFKSLLCNWVWFVDVLLWMYAFLILLYFSQGSLSALILYFTWCFLVIVLISFSSFCLYGLLHRLQWFGWEVLLKFEFCYPLIVSWNIASSYCLFFVFFHLYLLLCFPGIVLEKTEDMFCRITLGCDPFKSFKSL